VFQIYLKLLLLLFKCCSGLRKLLTFLVTIVQLVGRLSQDELIDQLPTFLPALFDAFNNQSPDIRKVGTVKAVDKML
jgi:CLIP-associating protein 1/2